MKNKIGNKGEEKWYPKYAPHIMLGTNISILDMMNRKEQIESLINMDDEEIKSDYMRIMFMFVLEKRMHDKHRANISERFKRFNK